MNDEKLDGLLNVWRRGRRERLAKGPKLSLEFAEAGVDVSDDHTARIRIWVKRIVAAVVVVFILAASAGAVTVAVRKLLAEAAELRQRLDAIRKSVGLDRAAQVTFSVKQPASAVVRVRIDPGVVQTVEATYDSGKTWRKLFATTDRPAEGEGAITIEDRQRFAPPDSGKRTVAARVRVGYVPEVVKAFPEYKEPKHTEFTGLFELSAKGIVALAGKDPKKAKPVIVMNAVPLAPEQWEAVHSLDAGASLARDPADGALVATFKLGKVGEWVNLSHSVPGARPNKPTVSLEEMTAISVTLLWKGKVPVTVEPKLVDDFGRIVGVLKFIEPSDKSQTIRVPVRAFRGYWDFKTFDFGRVRRVDLAVSRKATTQAARGTLKIQKIELLGTAKLPPVFQVARKKLVTLTALPLDPVKWQTFHNKPAAIKLAKQNGLLACQVSLPYDRKRDKDLPYTDIATKLEKQDYRRLQAIELELRWDGPGPITVELKLTTSEYGDTYGTQRQIKPGRKYQKILLCPHDLKYYWSTGAKRDAMRMDLRKLVQVALGIPRKSQDQADKGVLYIKAIRLLGPKKGPG